MPTLVVLLCRCLGFFVIEVVSSFISITSVIIGWERWVFGTTPVELSWVEYCLTSCSAHHWLFQTQAPVKRLTGKIQNYLRRVECEVKPYSTQLILNLASLDDMYFLLVLYPVIICHRWSTHLEQPTWCRPRLVSVILNIRKTIES